jgi:serine/threonine-protein kinase
MGILTQHMYKAPVPPRALPECPPDLPPGLEVIIMRCLRKKPEERYQTMEELEQDIDRLANGEVPKAAQDMMALSAGYQSLAQSALAAAGMPKPIPAEPMVGVPKTSKWPLYAGIAGVLVVVIIATAALMGGKSNATAAPSNTVAATNAPKPTATPTVTATETEPTTPSSTTTAAKKTKTILVDPPVSTAKIFDDQGKQIGDGSPGAQAIDIAEGQTKTLTVKAAGYKDTTVTLDYVKSPKKIVPVMKAIPSGATTKPTGGGGGSDIDNPWGKK